MSLNITFLGMDNENREVFKSIDNEKVYKRYRGEEIFYTAHSFDGEPDVPLGDDANIKRVMCEDTIVYDPMIMKQLAIEDALISMQVRHLGPTSLEAIFNSEVVGDTLMENDYLCIYKRLRGMIYKRRV